MPAPVIFALATLCILVFCGATASTEGIQYRAQRLTVDNTTYTVSVPSGYRLELLDADLDGPRIPTFNASGELFIGSRSGHVYRLLPPYKHAESLVFLRGYPHSVAFRRGEILIAMTDGLYRAPYRAGQKAIPEDSIALLARLPGGGGHNSRTVAVGPDGRVYLSLGLSGNCSDQYLGAGYAFDDQRGGVLVLREEGDKAVWMPYASGLRNPVGIAWHPATQVLYASNNGPDHWGFDAPPEYFSRLLPGSFHGMPWFQYVGGALKRDDCVDSDPPRPMADVSLPVAAFPARNAPLGITFVPDGAMDARFAGDAVVALHGSWGTKPSGGFFGDPASRREPKLVVVRFDRGEAKRVDDLVTGFQLKGGDRWARPAGVAVGQDGALYFTSDSGAEGLFRLVRGE
ncbi:MAG: sugar dehydrogenase [Gammaproteobacteria bacterium]|nr:sugar dehydrogenase [Gammaproteobacteria bacterium]